MCITGYHVKPPETYNRVEECNSCYDVVPTNACKECYMCITCYHVKPSETYNRVEECNSCYDVVPTNACKDRYICITCYHVKPPETYNRVEECNSCYDVHLLLIIRLLLFMPYMVIFLCFRLLFNDILRHHCVIIFFYINEHFIKKNYVL